MNLQHLQHITLQHQGLLHPSTFGTGKQAVLDAMERLGYLQIDTLSVVERAHHHTLWSRIPDYQPQYLDELLQERQVFEYWFHAASYLPMQEFRFVLPQMLEIKQNGSRYYRADPKVMAYVLDSIRAEGPKQSKDFESKSKQPGSWWNWKPTKLALERLFMQGDLMVTERKGMQKKYDLRERVLPASVEVSVPSPLEFAEYLVQTYLRAYGFTTVKQITHLKKGSALRNNVDTVLNSMLEEGSLQKVAVEGMPAVFVPTAVMEQSVGVVAPTVRFLSPFDNSIIHRDRLQQLFGYDFRLECYVPQAKRQFGYFCLPILFGTAFIGRMDCKAHRKEKRFEVIHLHVENEGIPVEAWLGSFMEVLKAFAVFNGCEGIEVTEVSPAGLKGALLGV
ncbi:winged helix-turn-helix domain-containing protein [Flavobacterium sp. PLA-1-15]|uniref:winged helix-turn-helix domain-containing protein n=1 Tax=Flavobacterium sp. PLA-1-15 TaxID=3380533 RepID=UPI003B7AB653